MQPQSDASPDWLKVSTPMPTVGRGATQDQIFVAEANGNMPKNIECTPVGQFARFRRRDPDDALEHLVALNLAG